MDRIFVQIASYRDTECQWTVKDLFDKAEEPDRVNVGICWQYDPEEDKDCFLVAPRPHQVRIAPYHWKESLGVCWARHQAGQLWEGEEYALLIDSHMRFVPGWDRLLIEQLAECASPRPFLSNHPARYTPPNDLQQDAVPNVLRAHLFTREGDIRFRGDNLDHWPDKPLRGAFLAAGFIFGRSDMIREVPYDPFMYFDQEEVSLAARLYTHGFDAYSLKNVLLYHYYRDGPNPKQPRLHWEDNLQWRTMHERAKKRLNHLLGYEESDDPEVVQQLSHYGLGNARTLEDYQSFCGIDFKHRVVHERGLRCGFIPNLSRYKDRPIYIPELDEQETATVSISPLPEISPPPASLPPVEMLMENNVIDRETVSRLAAYAEERKFAQTDGQSPIAIDGMVGIILPHFIHVCCDRLSPFFGVDVAWLARPYILSSAQSGAQANTQQPVHDSCYQILLFLNDGEDDDRISFPEQNYALQPRAGLMLAFPARHEFVYNMQGYGAGYIIVVRMVTQSDAPGPQDGIYLGHKRRVMTLKQIQEN